MGKFDNIVIVSDLDETFLGDGSRIVPRNLEAIEYFKANGGSFTVATGREDYLILHNIPDIADICNVPVIACNGAYICDMKTCEIKHEVFLDYEKVKPIIEHTAKIAPDVWMRVSSDGMIYSAKDPVLSGAWYKTFSERMRTVDLHTETNTKRWHKIVFEGEVEKVNLIREYFDTLETDDFEFIFAHPTVLEIMSKIGTKGRMLNKLKEVIGKPDCTVFAVGDYENDRQMLLMCDRSATPVNGLDSLKSIPGIMVLCDHDEGAIADLIYKIEAEIDSKNK